MRLGMIRTVVIIATFAMAVVLVSTTTPAQVVRGSITNNDVVRMVKQRMPEATIIAAIKAGPAKFDLSHSALLALEKEGVSPRVLMAMMVKGGLTLKPGTRVNPKLRAKFTILRRGAVVKNQRSAQANGELFDRLRRQWQGVPASLQRTAPGEYQVSPQSPLYPGEYAVVLRPVSKDEKISGVDVARGQGPGLMFDTLWSFQVAENAQ